MTKVSERIAEQAEQRRIRHDNSRNPEASRTGC
jgi:hypothetical protein